MLSKVLAFEQCMVCWVFVASCVRQLQLKMVKRSRPTVVYATLAILIALIVPELGVMYDIRCLLPLVVVAAVADVMHLEAFSISLH